MPQPSGADDPVETMPESVRAALPRCTADLLLLIGADGRLRWCNPALERLLGRCLGALAGLAWHEALPAASPATLLQAAARLARGEPVAGLEVELECGGAAPPWLRIAIHPLPTNEWLCVMQDITEAKRHEREARRSAEFLDMTQEFGRLGIWERDIASGVGHWDRHVFGFWGLDPDSAAPTRDDAIARIHPDDRPLMTWPSPAHAAGSYSEHYRVVRPDGSTRWIHSQWEIKASATGAAERAIGIMMDDTEVFELARSLGDASTQLRLVLELGNIGIWRHDLQTDLMHYNEGAQKVLGLPARPAGLSIAEARSLLHPDDVERVVAAAQGALASELPTDIEARFHGADGHWRTVLTRRVVERAPDGTPRAFVGIALDVSAQAEERRRTGELMQRMEAAAAAAGVGIWSYDVTTGQGQWNDTLFALVGRARDAGVPRRREFIDRFVHAGDRERMRRHRFAYGTSGDEQYRIELPSGQTRWLENRVRSEVRDGRPMVYGVTLDISDRRRAEEALRSADARAALAARGAGIGTWEMDLVGTDERWDEQMFRLRGLDPSPRVPSRAERLALLHPDDRHRVLDTRPQAWHDPQIAQYEFRVRWPDGSYRWLASRSRPVFDEAGRVLRRVGVNWDITESRLAESALRDRALAQRESLAKSQILSRVSHELRTPLNAVLGFTQLLQAEPASAAVRQARLGWIRSAAEHLLLLITDMLDLSSLAAGDLKLALEPVALAAFVSETLPLVARLAAQHGVALQTGDIDGVVLADRTRLRQVLINLLTNGIKYNHGHGHVRISAVATEGRVTLQVQDSGQGLDAEQIAHLFEPFNRLGAERQGIEGTGIGLVIVKALVERMNGAVRVCSSAAGGTTFSVDLPAGALPARPDDEALPRAPAVAAARAGRVLCIEDNPVNMLLVLELLAFRPGVVALEATTGAEGVSLALDQRPDLALIDMQLPDCDGFEVLRRLRADPRTAALRCIALSANALPEDIARARAAGFADYWTKPVDFDHFLGGIDAALASVRG